MSFITFQLSPVSFPLFNIFPVMWKISSCTALGTGNGSIFIHFSTFSLAPIWAIDKKERKLGRDYNHFMSSWDENSKFPFFPKFRILFWAMWMSGFITGTGLYQLWSANCKMRPLKTKEDLSLNYCPTPLNLFIPIILKQVSVSNNQPKRWILKNTEIAEFS